MVVSAWYMCHVCKTLYCACLQCIIFIILLLCQMKEFQLAHHCSYFLYYNLYGTLVLDAVS